MTADGDVSDREDGILPGSKFNCRQFKAQLRSANLFRLAISTSTDSLATSDAAAGFFDFRMKRRGKFAENNGMGQCFFFLDAGSMLALAEWQTYCSL